MGKPQQPPAPDNGDHGEAESFIGDLMARQICRYLDGPEPEASDPMRTVLALTAALRAGTKAGALRAALVLTELIAGQDGDDFAAIGALADSCLLLAAMCNRHSMSDTEFAEFAVAARAHKGKAGT